MTTQPTHKWADTGLSTGVDYDSLEVCETCGAQRYTTIGQDRSMTTTYDPPEDEEVEECEGV